MVIETITAIWGKSIRNFKVLIPNHIGFQSGYVFAYTIIINQSKLKQSQLKKAVFTILL